METNSTLLYVKWKKECDKMASIEERVETLIKNKIQDLGYNLYDVQYVKEGQNYFLRVFIEKPNGSIDLNDCEKVNDGINDLLDTADYIKDQYFLEVSSTGVEKILRKDQHLEDNIGNKVQISLFKPIDVANKKQKEIVGTLKEFDNDKIVVEAEEKEIEVERKNISQIKIFFDWDNLE